MIFLSELATILKVTGSKSPKGSSSIKISGLDIRTDAIATLTCCPPDNSINWRVNSGRGRSNASKIGFTYSITVS